MISGSNEEQLEIANDRADLLLEIERLNNIISELEKHLHQEILEWKDVSDEWTKAQVQEDEIILNKLKELKEKE